MTPNQMPRKGTRVIKVRRWDDALGYVRNQLKLQPLNKPNRSMADAMRDAGMWVG
jgi:hypothetical protein